MHHVLSQGLGIIKIKQIDVVYIRKAYLDFLQIKKIKKYKKNYSNLRVIMEIPTYPYDGEVKWYKYFQLRNDRNARKKLKGCVDCITTFTDDNEIYGIKTLRVLNGVKYNPANTIIRKGHYGINIIAVAMFKKWHGYDRFLLGMAANLQLVKSRNIHLLIVGKDGKKLYKKIVIDKKLSNYVSFYESCHGKKLESLYSISDIGLDAMGRHRVGVFYNSTLKGKEYTAHGLPVISGVKTELDDISFKYYMRFPSDDSNIAISKVIQFYDLIYANHLPDDIKSEIINQTKDLFEFKKTFLPVLEWLKK